MRSGADASHRSEPLRVLVVGQTPPPVHGQAVMIEALLRGRFEHIALTHVRMNFSDSVLDVGRARAGKLIHLAQLIRRIVDTQKRVQAEVLYYPPAGPLRVPVYRDIAVLLATRHLFRHTVFHFHAGGVGDFGQELSWPERKLFERAYAGADVAILLSDNNPPDGARLGAKRSVVVPYGIPDVPPWPGPSNPLRESADVPTVLFVGAVCKEKGVDTILAACRLLKARGKRIRAQIVGAFRTAAYESKARAYVREHGLDVDFAGVKTGEEKWRSFEEASIFCFPSFYAAETFGLVVLEAMRFGLPVVASRWRGIPTMVDHGDTGFLVEPRDATAVADRLAQLLDDPEARRRMGQAGRRRYDRDFTEQRWHARMEETLLAAAGRDRGDA